MDTLMIHIEMTIEQILQRWPSTFSVFMKNKTKCPGCLMQHFCKLKDVAETYHISAEELVNEIECVANSESIQRSKL